MIGRIYRIIHLESELCYIGSTMNELRWRWKQHKEHFNRWDTTGEGKITIFPYFREFGIDDFKMVLIKEYEVADKKHLLAYEALWMCKFKKTAVNRCCPFRIEDISRKSYRELNRSSINDKAKLYYESNKDAIHAKMKAYREKNQDNLRKQKAEKMICDCGGKWTKGHGFRIHERTQKHQKWIQANTDHELAVRSSQNNA